MRIIIKEKGVKKFSLRLPSALALSPVSVFLMTGRLGQTNGMKLTRRQAMAMAKALRRFRKKHKGWKLVEAESSDGSRVEIIL